MPSTSNFTSVQCQYVKDKINHRLRMGEPDNVLKLDSYRSLAFFKPNKIFGYIRWSANQYGTQDWRFHILKSSRGGYLTRILGVSPAVKVLSSAHGSVEVKRALSLLDRLEAETKNSLEIIPESYWRQFQSCLILKAPLRKLPRSYRLRETENAR